jgi:hypothetical protein
LRARNGSAAWADGIATWPISSPWAIPRRKQPGSSSPNNPEYRQLFRANRENLAEILVELAEHAAAAEAAGELIQAAMDPEADIYNAACIFARCVPLAERDGQLSESQRRE